MFKKVDTNLSFREREAETLRFWNEKGIFCEEDTRIKQEVFHDLRKGKFRYEFRGP